MLRILRLFHRIGSLAFAGCTNRQSTFPDTSLTPPGMCPGRHSVVHRRELRFADLIDKEAVLPLAVVFDP